jgi:hypothetical protein
MSSLREEGLGMDRVLVLMEFFFLFFFVFVTAISPSFMSYPCPLLHSRIDQ